MEYDPKFDPEPDITYRVNYHYFLGLLHQIRERSPLAAHTTSNKDVTTSEDKMKMKTTNSHFIIKLVLDEEDSETGEISTLGELLVYMRWSAFDVVAFGIRGKKPHAFSDCQKEFEDCESLGFDSSYECVGDNSNLYGSANVMLGKEEFVEAVGKVIDYLNTDPATITVQGRLKGKFEMIKIIIPIVEGARFDVVGTRIHRNELSLRNEQECPYGDAHEVPYIPANVEDIETMNRRIDLVSSLSYAKIDKIPAQLDTYITNSSNIGGVAQTYKIEQTRKGQIPRRPPLSHKE